jgi:hypothetical protein
LWGLVEIDLIFLGAGIYCASILNFQCGRRGPVLKLGCRLGLPWRCHQVRLPWIYLEMAHEFSSETALVEMPPNGSPLEMILESLLEALI